MFACLAPILAVLLMTSSSVMAADPAPGALVTPMTPDFVASYDPIRPDADFIKRVEMIPMRDGVKLYTVIIMKKGTKGGPILLSRTPYDAKAGTDRTRSQTAREVLPAMDAEFIEDGYIRVYQDIRGLHNSEGVFVMTRPIVGPLNTTGIDESTDAYDTIDWLVKHTPESNGKVGVIGSSYLGFTTLMAEINPHPALKASAPQSPMVDTWIGDDDFHNGAFRVPTIDYVVGQSVAKASGTAIPHGVGDDYSRYLEAGSAGDYMRRYGVDQVPSNRKLVENPAYTDFWSLQAVDKWMGAQAVTVPTLLVVGQWDQEDSYGAPAVFRAMKAHDTHNQVFLAIGPWRHSGVNHYGSSLGALTFTGDTALEFRVKYLKPFFDHYLKDGPDPHLSTAITYATGINQWEGSPKWPMGAPQKLYLHDGFTAAFEAPSHEPSGHDDYVSDPAKPVPFLPRPVNMADGAQWKTWLVRDQRFVSDRPDVLSYTTAPLTKPLHIMGAPEADLFAATSGTDSDFVVKLIDVYPNTSPEAGEAMVMAGYELPIGIEIYRARYVHAKDKPAALTPGKVEEYRFGLPNVDHVFLPGHRLMVQVQSSLFPLYDRNPQTFVANIFNAKASDYQKATQSIFHTEAAASGIILPVVGQ